MKKGKYKIVIYTITKNEENFIKRYCESAKDADEIYVFDTGSTDSTISIAKDCGAIVHKIHVSPWRFDVARNASLAMLSSDADICIALDADEVMEPGWREVVEELWQPDTTRMSYLFDWSCGIQFNSTKIHSRNGYLWKYPCHEMIMVDPRVKENFVSTNKLLIRHLPDHTKSRGQYLDLLEVTVKEYPLETRHAFFYARELMFYDRFEDSIRELKKYLEMPNATWSDERAYAMRLIGDIYKNLGNFNESLLWYEKGAQEAPHRKESWYKLAQEYHNRHIWDKSYESAKKCIELPNSKQWPTDPNVDGALPYDYYAIAAFNIGKKDEAFEMGKKALELAPNDMRIKNNMEFYK
jgi:glycosyltransferase involved in cell wall biosynthesis